MHWLFAVLQHSNHQVWKHAFHCLCLLWWNFIVFICFVASLFSILMKARSHDALNIVHFFDWWVSALPVSFWHSKKWKLNHLLLLLLCADNLIFLDRLHKMHDKLAQASCWWTLSWQLQKPHASLLAHFAQAAALLFCMLGVIFFFDTVQMRNASHATNQIFMNFCNLALFTLTLQTKTWFKIHISVLSGGAADLSFVTFSTFSNKLQNEQSFILICPIADLTTLIKNFHHHFRKSNTGKENAPPKWFNILTQWCFSSHCKSQIEMSSVWPMIVVGH